MTNIMYDGHCHKDDESGLLIAAPGWALTVGRRWALLRDQPFPVIVSCQPEVCGCL